MDVPPPCDCGALAWYALRTRIIELETQLMAVQTAVRGARLNLDRGRIDVVMSLLDDVLTVP